MSRPSSRPARSPWSVRVPTPRSGVTSSPDEPWRLRAATGCCSSAAAVTRSSAFRPTGPRRRPLRRTTCAWTWPCCACRRAPSWTRWPTPSLPGPGRSWRSRRGSPRSVPTGPGWRPREWPSPATRAPSWSDPTAWASSTRRRASTWLPPSSRPGTWRCSARAATWRSTSPDSWPTAAWGCPVSSRWATRRTSGWWTSCTRAWVTRGRGPSRSTPRTSWTVGRSSPWPGPCGRQASRWWCSRPGAARPRCAAPPPTPAR